VKRREFLRKAGAASAALAGVPTLAHTLAKSAWADDKGEKRTGPVILEIDIENNVDYFNDVTDYAKLATDPNPTAVTPFNDFGSWSTVGDIVAVNSEPAKGTFLVRATTFRLGPKGTPRSPAIADVIRRNFGDFYWEILRADDTPVGTIMAIGATFGSPPPRAPSAQNRDNLAVIGGTGAFLGVRGEAGQTVAVFQGRAASMIEDPANRRVNGGGPRQYVLQLFFPSSKEDDRD
jgi:hypothetical protein